MGRSVGDFKLMGRVRLGLKLKAYVVIDAYLKLALNSHSPAATKTQNRAYTRSFFRLKMWERTLQDLVRGLRANKKDEAKFIATAVDEIRQEIKSDDMGLKAAAVLKLTYVCSAQYLL